MCTNVRHPKDSPRNPFATAFSAVLSPQPTMATTASTSVQIKLFHFIRTLVETTDIYSPHQTSLLNRKVLLILLCFSQMLFASISFFLFEAQTIGEFAYSYLISLTIAICFGFMIEFALNLPNSLKLIGRFEELIQKSECFFYFTESWFVHCVCNTFYPNISIGSNQER